MRLDRTNDYLFKFLFGTAERKDALLDFINAVLTDGSEENIIAEITLMDRGELDPEHYEDKYCRLNILAKTREGSCVNIEVQTTDEKDIDKRSLYYWGKLYCDQMKKGMRYRDLKQAIVINVLTFNYFEEAEYHNVFEIRNRKSHSPLNENFQMHFIELKKWSSLSRKAMNRLERWLLFISDNNPEELEEVAMLNPMIKSALEAEQSFSTSEQNRYIYDLREKGRMDYLSAVGTAREDGKKEGIQEGEQKTKMEVARNMLRAEFDVHIVSKMTGLPVETVQRLSQPIV